MFCASCRAPNDDTAETCSGCRRPLAPIASGTVIADRYEIQGVLGRGGMGVVYRAHDRTLDEPVALKVVRGELAAAPELEQRFFSEIKLARRVSHWNVCRIHDYSQHEGVGCLSMELVEGTDLKRVLKARGALPPEEAFDIAIQAAEGLIAIHQVGVVHRDLKPSNVMVDAQGRVRLMDFGIAKRLAWEVAQGETGSGYVVGTPEYMSPEQARGRTLDVRSDIYSLGIVIFELFTGRVPFADDTPVATILRQIDETPPLGEHTPSQIPPALARVLRRALAKKPDDRFASAQELAGALRDARDADQSKPTAARRPGAVSRRLALWSLPVGALALGAAWLLSRKDSVAPPSAAAVAAATTTPSATAAPTFEPTRSPRLAATAAVATVATPTPKVTAVVPVTVPTPTLTSEPPPATPPPLPTETAPPLPSPTAPPVSETGLLQLAIKPWAVVTIDGTLSGQTPLPRIPLSAGPHLIILTFENREYRRKITIAPGQTVKLEVDMRTDAVRRAK